MQDSKERAMTRQRGRLSRLLQGYRTSINELNSSNIAELWLGLLRFYSLLFDEELQFVSIITTGELYKEDKSWPKSKRLAIEGKFWSCLTCGICCLSLLKNDFFFAKRVLCLPLIK